MLHAIGILAHVIRQDTVGALHSCHEQLARGMEGSMHALGALRHMHGAAWLRCCTP